MILLINNRHKFKVYNLISRKISFLCEYSSNRFFCYNRKSKVLANQYQLLVDQRQAEIDRLNKSLEEKNLIVARVERTTQDEVIFYFPRTFPLYILSFL